VIFVVRTLDAHPPPDPRVRIVQIRATPPLVAAGPGQQDVFCVGDESESDRLQAEGWNVVRLHDGWYADDEAGGVAVWGNGRYWEVRATPFDVIAQG
jgi:hypothetical protein